MSHTSIYVSPLQSCQAHLIQYPEALYTPLHPSHVYNDLCPTCESEDRSVDPGERGHACIPF